MDYPSTIVTEKLRIALPSSNILQDWQEIEWSMRAFVDSQKTELKSIRDQVNDYGPYTLQGKIKELNEGLRKVELRMETANAEIDSFHEWMDEEKQKMQVVSKQLSESVHAAWLAREKLEKSINKADDKIGWFARIFKK